MKYRVSGATVPRHDPNALVLPVQAVVEAQSREEARLRFYEMATYFRHKICGRLDVEEIDENSGGGNLDAIVGSEI